MNFGARFLRHPDLFPARPSGDPWGEESAVVDLPGGPYEIIGLSGSQLEAMRARFGATLSTDAATSGVTRVRVFATDPGDFLDTGPPGWNYDIDMDPLGVIIRLAAPEFLARVERAAVGTTAVWTALDGDGFSGVVENVLRVLVAHRVLASGGLVLHSSGVVVRERCFLFAGPSGAGKSTVAGLALARGHRVLSDDLNVLIPHGDRFLSRRMPFAGSVQSESDDATYPIEGILRLRKSEVHRCEPMSAAEAYSLILGCSPFVNIDPFVATTLEGTISRVVAVIPRWSLAFRKDGGLWPIIESL